MKATPRTDAIQAQADAFSARFWELKLSGLLTDEAITAQLTTEGCPTADEIEAVFIAETGMSFDMASEVIHAERAEEAMAQYYDDWK